MTHNPPARGVKPVTREKKRASPLWMLATGVCGATAGAVNLLLPEYGYDYVWQAIVGVLVPVLAFTVFTSMARPASRRERMRYSGSGFVGLGLATLACLGALRLENPLLGIMGGLAMVIGFGLVRWSLAAKPTPPETPAE